MFKKVMHFYRMRRHASVDRRFRSATIWPNLKPKNAAFPVLLSSGHRAEKQMCNSAVNFIPEISSSTVFIGHWVILAFISCPLSVITRLPLLELPESPLHL